jgi:DNA-binding IclR family transcriptional regulator
MDVNTRQEDRLTNRIPAIDRALEVLDILSRDPGATISSLSEQLGIPRSTVYRIVNSLEAGGVATRDQSNGYHLGPKLMRWGAAVPKGVDLVDLAKSHLERLAREETVTAKLSVLDGDAALVVATAEGRGRYTISTQVGSRFPLHAGAASKVLLAYADAALQDRILAGELVAATENTVTDPKVIRALLAQVAAEGYATDHSEFVPGINAVAAPVFGPDGHCIGAISVPYIAAEGLKKEAAWREVVVETAKTLTRQIGGFNAQMGSAAG